MELMAVHKCFRRAAVLLFAVMASTAAAETREIYGPLEPVTDVSLAAPSPQSEAQPARPLRALRERAGPTAARKYFASGKHEEEPQPLTKVTYRNIPAKRMNFEAPAQGLAVRMELASGSEVYRPDQHIMVGALTGDNSWRREVDISLTPASLAEAGITLKTGAFSGRRPLLYGYGTRNGVGDLTRWQQSNSWDFGIEAKPEGLPLSYSGGFAWSQYSVQTAVRSDGQFDLLTPKPDWRRGTSWWHKLDSQLWKGAEGEASAYITFGRMDERYRTFQRHSDTPLIYEGRTFEFGGEFRRGNTEFDFTYSSIDGPWLGIEETSAAFEKGAFKVDVELSNWTYNFDEGLDWKSEDRVWKGKLRVSLPKLFGKGLEKGFAPTHVTLRMERKRGSETLFGSNSQWDRTKLGFGLSWSRKGSETDLFIDTVRANKPALGGLEPDSQREITAEFTQTFYGDNWSLTAYGSLSDQRSRFSADKFFAAGASFSLNEKKLPKISFSVDLNKFGIRMRDADFGPEDYLLSERQLRVSASLDLSKFLPKAGKDEKKPFLKLKAYGDWSMSKESFEGSDKRMRPTMMVVYGKTF